MAHFEQNLELLKQPFPAEILDTKNGFTYIPHAYVTDRLNEALGVGAWSFEIRQTEIVEKLYEVHVLGRLTATIETPEGTVQVVKEQWGGQKINCDRDGNIVELGNDLKGAGSDALKKCATLLGVGLDLYMDGHKPANGGGQRNGGNGGGGAKALSDKQKDLIETERKRRKDANAYIFKLLGEKTGMPELQGKPAEEAAKLYQDHLAKLSSKDASILIDWLKEQPFKGQAPEGAANAG